MEANVAHDSEVAVSVVITSATVFAASQFALICQVQCSPERDLTGHAVHILAADGSLLHTATLSTCNGGFTRTEEIVLIAPCRAGPCQWSAVLAAPGAVGLPRNAVARCFTFEVLPHRLSILVWGVKSAAIAAEEVTFTVGIKCGCCRTFVQRRLGIFDHRGELMEEVIVPNQIWPGSEAIYFVAVALTAPMREGQSNWEVRAMSTEENVTHVSEPVQFALRTVPKSECSVIVKTVERDGGTPVGRAIVCLHPFRTTSDATGVATLRVPKGDYRLLVSAPSHAAVGREVTIADHYSTCVELVAVPPQNPYSDWSDTH